MFISCYNEVFANFIVPLIALSASRVIRVKVARDKQVYVRDVSAWRLMAASDGSSQANLTRRQFAEASAQYTLVYPVKSVL